ncbi:hypothetical protein TTHERM_00670380 (macronuclear) [Tetrahymena thermophila SB210]|uniref:Uncharacterized protein n=1 Tax=Tetrahymena thermophila (strain SB210) TaxID=312017 RepID=I7MJB1_TETTS|nr:hypothetical protein TTHERM_00670380 [Tetrahymena thermophila SB210]EAS06114.1 hypothetical protein TTHERM_00670380 [Tetrahymena thermophila SB210]|eukprot:XP_001026359.1 hypothetical protein TTHERM_00670380 [Tetrahymena thermophila SB210]
MNPESKYIEFKTKKDDLMKQYTETFVSIAEQLKISDNPYEEQSKQNILRKDVLEFLKVSQQLLNLSNDIKKHVILNDDIYQTNDEFKLSEKDLLERKQNLRYSYENKQKEMEIQIKERQQRVHQQNQASHPNQPYAPSGNPQIQGQGNHPNVQYQRQMQTVPGGPHIVNPNQQQNMQSQQQQQYYQQQQNPQNQ